MTDATKDYKPLSLSALPQTLPVQLMYHNLFRYLRPCRKKYNMTINELLVLNGIYIYTLIQKTEFTMNAIYLFMGYYNRRRMGYYIDRLLNKHGCIVYHNTIGKYVYYRISVKGFDIVKELFDNFEIVQQKFLQKWNVSI